MARPLFIAALAGPLLAGAPGAAPAAPQDAPAPAPAPPRPVALDNPHQIDHWDTRPAARELLAHADALRRDGALRGAVDAWLRLEREHGHLLAPGAPDPDGLHEHYTSVHALVRERLAALTPAERDTVRDLVDDPAARELARVRPAPDPAALEAVAAAAPWAATAPAALTLAGDRHLERGDAGAAAWCYRQALALHRDAPPDGALPARCGRALALAGRAAELRALADRLARTWPGGTLPGAAGPVPAATELRRLAAAVRPAALEWPEPDPSGGPGAEPPPFGRVERPWVQRPDAAPVRRIADPNVLPPMPSPFAPVAADGICVLHTGTALAAIDLADLSLAWQSDGEGVAEDWDGHRAGGPGTQAAAIAGDVVAAALDEPGLERARAPNRVVLCDLHTGENRAPVLRALDCRDARDPDTQLRFTGVPAWRGGRLLTGVVRFPADGARPDEAWVYGLRLDRRAGEPRWRVVTRTFVTTEAQHFVRTAGAGAVCTVVDGGDRCFVATQMGTLAAVDPLSGRLLWLVKYRLTGGAQAREATFHPGRPLVGPSTVSYGPPDSDSLYVCDRDTGALCYAAVGEHYDPAQYDAAIPRATLSGPWRGLLGLCHDRLFVHRDRSIEILAPERAEVRGRRVVWAAPVRSDDQRVPVQAAEADPADLPRVMGRPAFAPHGVALAGGSTLAILPIRVVRGADGATQVAMTGAPIDDLDLATLPGPDAGEDAERPGPLLAGACLRVDGLGVPVRCRRPLAAAPGQAPETCLTRLPRPAAVDGAVTCPRCGHRTAARRVRYCVLVSRDFLTALQLAPPAGAPGGTHGR